MHAPSDHELASRLREAGVTPTTQRLRVARVLLERDQHLSAEQVMARLKASGQRPVSKATVYNTLGLFAQVGLVRQVFADPTRVLYDSNVSDHHHLYDVDSGELTDVSHESVHVQGLPELTDDMELAGVDVIIKVRSRRR